jgi:hypothetical protein
VCVVFCYRIEDWEGKGGDVVVLRRRVCVFSCLDSFPLVTSLSGIRTVLSMKGLLRKDPFFTL